MLVSMSRIPLSIAIPHMRGWDKNRYTKLFARFGAKYRIYLPLDNLGVPIKDQKSSVRDAVADYLKKSKIEISNYVAGTCTDGRRTFRIGKLLDDELRAKFAADPVRKSFRSNYMVVISRHPYDLIGMSFDRGWKSCMHLLHGEGKSYITRDLEHGTLIAYLVKNDDKNINNPIARVRLVAFKPGLPDLPSPVSHFVPDSVYGNAPASFITTVKKFCKLLNAGNPKTSYRLPKNVYHEVAPLLLKTSNIAVDRDLKYCTDSESVLEQMVARIRNKAPVGILEKYVAENRFVEPEVIERLFERVANSKSSLRSTILLEMADNPQTPIGVLHKIVGQGQDLAIAAMYNRNATQDLMLVGIEKFPELASGVALFHRAKAPVLQKVLQLNPKLLATVLSNPNCPEQLIRENVDQFATTLALRDEPWVQELVFTNAMLRKDALALTTLIHNHELDSKVNARLWSNRQEIDSVVSGIRWGEQ